jgi:hypothetical protein
MSLYDPRLHDNSEISVENPTGNLAVLPCPATVSVVNSSIDQLLYIIALRDVFKSQFHLICMICRVLFFVINAQAAIPIEVKIPLSAIYWCHILIIILISASDPYS